MIHYVGLAKTKEMIITADPIGADEARRIGLINQIFKHDEFMDRVYAYAERLLANSPFAMGMAKHVVNMCVNADMPHRPRYRTAGPERARAVGGP